MMPDVKSLSEFIVDRVDFGIFAVDRELKVLLWNRFMQIHSARKPKDIIGKSLLECFPELPAKWLQKKFESVFLLKNFSFTSWEQRPYLFRFRHNRPITGGIDYMQQNCTFLPLMDEAGEVQAVCVTLLDMTDVSLIQRELERTMAALKESADRDGLTGAFNRRHLEERLSEEFDRYLRYGGVFSVLILDLDHFKLVNDEHGHLAGDAVLRAVANCLGAGIRHTDIFGRYGGEEFAVMLPGTGLMAAMTTAEKLRQSIAREAVAFRDLSLSITTSIGATAMRPGVTSHEVLIAEADAALYRAKALGRNRCVAYEPPGSAK